MFSLASILITSGIALGVIILIAKWLRKSGEDKVINNSLKKSMEKSREIKKENDKIDSDTTDDDVTWLQQHSSKD